MNRLDNIKALSGLRELLGGEMFRTGRNALKICCGLPCSTLGSQKVVQALEEEASNSNAQVYIVKTGCQGLCQKGPIIQVEPYGFFYQKVQPEKAHEIISSTYSTGQPLRELIYRDSILEAPKA